MGEVTNSDARVMADLQTAMTRSEAPVDAASQAPGKPARVSAMQRAYLRNYI